MDLVASHVWTSTTLEPPVPSSAGSMGRHRAQEREQELHAPWKRKNLAPDYFSDIFLAIFGSDGPDGLVIIGSSNVIHPQR